MIRAVLSIGFLPAVLLQSMVLGWPPAQEAEAPTTAAIQVFFSRHPESDDDFGAVFPVERVVSAGRVEQAALEALIGGPTAREQALGYFSELGQMLTGSSACAGQDFIMTLENGIATVRFCRPVSSAGVGQDVRAHVQIDATLTQFPTVRQVRLLSVEGHCLFDASGQDQCLEDSPRPLS